MKYAILLMFVIISMIGCGLPKPLAVPATQHMEMAQILKSRAVALVGTNRNGEIEAFCSGTWVTASTILTAHHCVEGNDYTNYVVNSDVFAVSDPTVPRLKIKPRLAMIVARDIDHDLALLGIAFPIPYHGIAPVADYDVVQGQVVQTMGQPIGLWFSYSSGDVAAIRVMPNALGFEMLLIQTTAPISPGNSGGGLFDESGNLVGVCHGAFNGGPENINLFIHTKYARSILK